MVRQAFIALFGVALVCQLSGCMVNETKPLPKINPVQAKTQISADELLDVGVHEFDPNVPEALAKDPEKLAKARIYPDIRKAEARYIPATLRANWSPPGNGARCVSCHPMSSSSTSASRVASSSPPARNLLSRSR